MPTTASYGTWDSPISADMVASSSIRLGGVALDGEDLYWLEGRPTEGGRNVLVRNGKDVTPAPFNVRNRVHEYGGAAFLVSDGRVFFASYADQRLYAHKPGEAPRAVTPDPGDGKLRYAIFAHDKPRDRLICIVEDHRGEGEAKNYVAAVSLADGAITPLAQGRDFYSMPTLSPDGQHLAWQCWDHPNMPWDGSEIWRAPVVRLDQAKLVAGGKTESVFQPEWSPEGTLYFVAETTGWWNLYREGSDRPVLEMEAEFGLPQWNIGVRTYAFLDANRVLAIYTQHGSDHLGIVDVAKGTLDPIDLPYSAIGSPHLRDGSAYFVAQSPTSQAAVVRLDLATRKTEELKRSSQVELDPGYVSVGRPVEFPTERGLTAHGFFYPPTSRDFAGPPDEKPPLVVMSHGGPTSASDNGLSMSIQYRTSRGWAVLDVNYGGSTGYGRDYRQRLNGNWGIVDVDDCVNGAKYLAAQGEVDGDRMAIRGGSAGGYTTLAALAFRDAFKVGASYYGIGDLEALAKDTHKFESRYLDSVVAPYPAQRDVYVERSPLHHLEGFSCPVIFFQGLEDKVVPPNQAESMVDALKQKGIAVEYHAFEGEQHGFRKAENIKKALESEMEFFGKVLGIRWLTRV